MINRIYVSNEDSLFMALEDIYLQFKSDYFINDYDFIFFAISPKFFPEDINPSIKKIFNTNKYIAFNALNAFSHEKLSKSVIALFFKFEKNGKINIKTVENVDSSKLNLVFIPFNDKKNQCICDVLNKLNFPAIGGVCSGDEAYIYYDNIIEKENPIIIEFDNVDYEFGLSLGYKPIGPTYKVHVAKKNKVYVIDYKDASLLIKKFLNKTDGNIKNLWYSPLLIISDKTGLVDFVRTYKDIKENYYVEFFGKIESNSNVKFSFATNDMLLEEDKRVALNVKKNISAELVFNFSCIAREYVLEDKKMEENKIYSRILNSPVFGFFTYGEIAPDYEFKISKLYNQTSLVVAIKEK